MMSNCALRRDAKPSFMSTTEECYHLRRVARECRDGAAAANVEAANVLSGGAVDEAARRVPAMPRLVELSCPAAPQDASLTKNTPVSSSA